MKNSTSLAQYLPAAALPYCLMLWEKHGFELRVVKPRRTRLGDFTKKPNERPRITLNANLNPYSFLLTYLHEVAHHVVYSTYKKRVNPHGSEWKKCFHLLLLPVLNEDCFPADVLPALIRYAANPKASTGGDPNLVHALARYDQAGLICSNKKILSHLIEGVNFVFQNREFIRGPLRRTRVLCVEKTSNRRYTIPAHALVEECNP
ncbi:SprT-like domain-containing protein [Arundinibacter roseus]|uniref:SprT-like domain-containing protein n=1 Tax=Arundinibacter roseus TaxID=2070510 RepID=A0A4R4KL36_9BACT|nr:SprT-like domain-containing protein [Arundinibacter roseus]TDB69047.1 hypothetical protein EZE20_01560 [Arundinibacter roseus]